MEFIAQQLFWGAVLPAVITVVLLALGWSAWQREGGALQWFTPLALAVGYLFAHWRIVGLPLVFPPVDSNEWLFVAGATMGAWGVIEQLASSRSRLVQVAGRAVVIGVVSWLILRPSGGNVWQGASAYVWWLVLALLWWLWWSLQARWAEQTPALILPLVLSIVAGAGGFVLLWSNSSSLSQLSGAIAAVAGAAVPLILWKRRASLGDGGVAFLAGMLGLLWINAIAFAGMPWWRAAIMALASLSPLLALLPALKHKPIWVTAATCALITAVLLGSLMLPTYRAYLAAGASYGY